MVYDVLNIEKDVYSFKQQSMAGSKVREVTLNGKTDLCDMHHCSTTLH